MHLQSVALWATDGDAVAREQVPGHGVDVKARLLADPESPRDVAGDRRDLQRRPRQVPVSEVNAVADQRPTATDDPVADQRRAPTTQVHCPDPRQFAAAKHTADDRDEVEIAPPCAEGAHARRPDDVEPIDATGNGSIQSREQIINNLLRQCRQHGGSVIESPSFVRVTHG
jgi:hypothetical protein